jgi:hypothetical protein
MEDPFATSDALPCSECPRELLQEYLASPRGQMLLAIMDIDFALQAGMAAWFQPVSYLEFLLLRQLTEERDKYQAEVMQKQNKQRGGN